MGLSIHIEKRYEGFSLKADLEHPGGITGFLGASGCGKSTALKCIAGIEKPDRGRIALNGRVLFDSERGISLKPQERRVGYLFQNYALFPNMTVLENIACGLNRIRDRKERRRLAGEAIEQMELGGQAELLPHQLSGGQQQRTALARMLVSEPEVLLLDEPFSALDAFLREQMQTQVSRILREYGKDVILVSHNRDELYYMCDRLAVMHEGRILTYGLVKEVFADPGTVTAATLTGCKNIAAARKTGEQEVFVPDWGVALKTGKPIGEGLMAVGIRAHYFHPSARDNLFPVEMTGRREEPFENRIMFRFLSQKPGTRDLWWRVPKDRTPGKMPEKLGIAPQNILLLYGNEEKTEDKDKEKT